MATVAQQEKTALPNGVLLLPDPAPVNNVSVELPEYDWEEILKHNKPRDLWMVVGGNVYNVGEFMYHHPGGPEVYFKNHGQDATGEFLKVGHPPYAMALTASFLIGRVKQGSVPPAMPGMASQAGKCPFDFSASSDVNNKGKEPENVAVPIVHDDNSKGKEPEKTEADPPISSSSVTLEPKPEVESVTSADGLKELPIAIEKLILKGERFVNFPLLNENDTQMEFYNKFGHAYQVIIPGKPGGRIIVVSDPDLLDEVAGNSEQFGKKVEGINFFTQLKNARGGGLSIISDSPVYDKVRRVMLPWYSPQHQRTQFPRMKDVAKSMLKVWDEDIPLEQPIDMRDWMTRYSLEISGRGACNYDFRLLSANPKRSNFARAVPEVMKEGLLRVVEPAPDKHPIIGGNKELKKRSVQFHAQTKVLFETANSIVTNRENACPLGTQTDLLSRLSTESDPESGEKLDHDTVRDQILMHLSNGFNGPSLILSWLCHVMAIYPEVEAKVIAEIDSISGGDPDYDLQYADLMNMKYITQVIKETLRLFAPMPVTVRNSLKDGNLGPYRIKKGDIIFVGAMAAHRDPRHWGQNATEFNPDNFLLEKVLARHRHAFIPFSVGIRQCMAQEVSFMMMRVAMFHIWNKYHLRMAPGAKVVKKGVTTTTPVSVMVVREKREGKEERQRQFAISQEKSVITPQIPVNHEWDVPSELPADSPYIKLSIAYGSNFGSSKALAEQLHDKSKFFGFEPKLVSLNSLIDLPVQKNPWMLFIVTPTYTSNPPGNAHKFKSWLQQTQVGCETWKNCRFAVFGLGNSQWNAFGAFPKFVNAQLLRLQAHSLAEFGIGDVNTPAWESQFNNWKIATWPSVLKYVNATPSQSALKKLEEDKKREEELNAMDSATSLLRSLSGVIAAPAELSNSIGIQTISSTVLENRELQSNLSNANTRHIVISLPSNLNYTAGDHLGVCPQNTPYLVKKTAKLLGVPLEGLFSLPPGRTRTVPSNTVLSIRNVLTNLVDLGGPVTASMISALCDCNDVPDEKDTLTEMHTLLLSEGNSPVVTQLKSGQYNIVELLNRFRGSKLHFFQFLNVVSPLKPRYYSTSSSPTIHGNDLVHISVGRLILDVPSTNSKFYGLSSNYIYGLKEGDSINIFLEEAAGFHMQDDVTKPMIMVSAGTGYAPMRAFLFERQVLQNEGKPMGEALLFNGIRHSDHDYIYREEIDDFVKSNILTHLHIAESRKNPSVKQYVQHKIKEQAPLVWDLLEKGAFIYVCGSAQMRDDVFDVFVGVVVEQGGKSVEEAKEYMRTLEGVEHRYRPDVWS